MFKSGTLVKGNSTCNYLTGIVLWRSKPARDWLYFVRWSDKTEQFVFSSQISRF